ncbi:hypothetical protein IJI94_00480 [Candidatus Saccharibacteria bacterium]|nr:hypothetical protein [Candidatus Saccharibacteria bacterium]
MKRLLKISLDNLLLSFTPILSWLLMGIIIDKSLINIFTLMYPIQFIWAILKNIFSNGANISKQKDKNPNAVMSGLIIGGIVSATVFLAIIVNIEKYINFMNMSVERYKVFSIYYIIQLFIQLMLAFILEKLYYENKNSLANKYSLIFNILNFITLIGCTLLIKNQIIVVVTTITVIALYTLFCLIKCADKFKLKLSIINCIKYTAVDLVGNIVMFISYLIGLKIVAQHGDIYAAAIAFVSLITDTQWDVFKSIETVAQIDVSKKRFKYKEHLRNAYRLLGILLFSISLLFVSLYRFYDLDIKIVIAYLAIEFIDLAIHPLYKMKCVYLTIEWSAIKTSTNKIITGLIRMIFSFLSTPFCTTIGQLLSSLYECVSINIMYRNNKPKLKDLSVVNNKG